MMWTSKEKKALEVKIRTPVIDNYLVFLSLLDLSKATVRISQPEWNNFFFRNPYDYLIDSNDLVDHLIIQAAKEYASCFSILSSIMKFPL